MAAPQGGRAGSAPPDFAEDVTADVLATANALVAEAPAGDYFKMYAHLGERVCMRALRALQMLHAARLTSSSSERPPFTWASSIQCAASACGACAPQALQALQAPQAHWMKLAQVNGGRSELPRHAGRDLLEDLALQSCAVWAARRSCLARLMPMSTCESRPHC